MLKDDVDMDKFFENLVEASSSMYLLGIHYTVVKTILSNPDWYAENSVSDSKALRQFKENATIKGLKLTSPKPAHLDAPALPHHHPENEISLHC